MAAPSYPATFIPATFANQGEANNIPLTRPGPGLVSWNLGFPPETQEPLNDGGIAPNRRDFNGVFKAMTAIIRWTQTGGEHIYAQTLDYETPCVVFYDNNLWFCKAANGPGTTVGVKVPDAEEDYWITLAAFLSGGGGGSLGGVPVGTVITFYGTTAPEGYLACDGASFSTSDYPALFAVLGSSILPDLRGTFLRGIDPTATHDPDGATRAIGSIQLDAGRNVTGSVSGAGAVEEGGTYSGAIYRGGYYKGAAGNGRDYAFGIDASRVWGADHTATEFRPVNACVLYCIKHD